MVFSSIIFICVFLPCIYILHAAIPSVKVRNALLLIASLLFYAYGEPVYVLILIGSSLFNYLLALLLARERFGKLKLAVAVIVNLGVLGVFKYAGFLTESFNKLSGLSVPVPAITLPIGISFFTFQALSYVIDVYRKRVDAQKNYAKVLLYIAFFPQLIAGPIVKYRDISEEIDSRKVELRESVQGLRRFIVGLGKKVLIANTMALAADHIFNAPKGQVNAAVAWVGALAYLLQIYFDFSGYSDMAIGMGRMFGFHFKENFLFPYGSRSIKEFWRRWHISLSGWFKEYLYIPLGGNRKGRGRTCLNKLIVFFCTGLWHGASWNFVVWGLFHGAFLLLEDFVPAIRKLPKALGHIYTMLVVCSGFVLFRAETLADGVVMIGRMFSGFFRTGPAQSLLMEQLTPWFIAAFVIGVFLMAPVRPLIEKFRAALTSQGAASASVKALNIAGYVLSFCLLGICIMRLSGSTYNPFIYFRF